LLCWPKRRRGSIGAPSGRFVGYWVRLERGTACLDQHVGDVMTSQVYVVKPSTPVDDCMALMSEKGIRHVPVMEGKDVLGIVSNRDVVVEAIANRESLLTGIDVLIANHEFPT